MQASVPQPIIFTGIDLFARLSRRTCRFADLGFSMHKFPDIGERLYTSEYSWWEVVIHMQMIPFTNVVYISGYGQCHYQDKCDQRLWCNCDTSMTRKDFDMSSVPCGDEVCGNERKCGCKSDPFGRSAACVAVCCSTPNLVHMCMHICK